MNTTGARRETLIQFAAVIGFFVLWQVGAATGWVNRDIFASPADLGRIAITQLSGGALFVHIGVSLLRVLAGFAIGAGLAVFVGLAMGSSERIRVILNPIVEILRPIPPLAWIPLAIIWFGIEESSKVFLIAVTAFFPVVVNTYKGVAGIDRTLLRAARSFDVPASRMLTRVALPAAMPDITTGLRIGWSLSFAVLVAAEMIAANSGLGFLITDAMNQGRFDVVVFGIVLIGSISVATDAIWRKVIDRYLLFWHRGIEAAGG